MIQKSDTINSTTIFINPNDVHSSQEQQEEMPGGSGRQGQTSEQGVKRRYSEWGEGGCCETWSAGRPATCLPPPTAPSARPAAHVPRRHGGNPPWGFRRAVSRQPRKAGHPEDSL